MTTKVTSSYDRHGDTNSKEYRAWTAAKSNSHREEPQAPRPVGRPYKKYDAGGPETKPLKRTPMSYSWYQSYREFLTDIGRAPTPEHRLAMRRKAKGYVPGNVFWAPKRTRPAPNPVKARSNRAYHTVTVPTKTGTKQVPLSEFAARFNVPYDTMRRRVVKWKAQEITAKQLIAPVEPAGKYWAVVLPGDPPHCASKIAFDYTLPEWLVRNRITQGLTGEALIEDPQKRSAQHTYKPLGPVANGTFVPRKVTQGVDNDSEENKREGIAKINAMFPWGEK